MKRLLWIVGAVQVLLAIRVFGRMARTRDGQRISCAARPSEQRDHRLTILVPVLNEAFRLGPCLESLRNQTATIDQIVVIDGGSTDGTQAMVRASARQDPRIHLVDAAPVPHGVNGKAFGQSVGARDIDSAAEWILTIDADVRLAPEAVDALMATASDHQLPALSVATTQQIEGSMLGILHPSMLTTLVYRFGIPGQVAPSVAEVQANGQCFLVRRHLLERAGGFEGGLHVIAEDVALARAIVELGEPIGFFESDELVTVEMHAGARDAWANWPRSLPLPERLPRWRSNLGLAEILLVQAAPPHLLSAGLMTMGWRSAFSQLQIGLVLARLGVLAGTARAYPTRPWTYWFSPLADLPVAVEIMRRSRRSTHTWRGRALITGGTR